MIVSLWAKKNPAGTLADRVEDVTIYF